MRKQPKPGMLVRMTGERIPTADGEVVKVNGGCMTVRFDEHCEAEFTIGRLASNGTQFWQEMVTGEVVCFTEVQQPKIEGYGVKGMGSTQWRKQFKNAAALQKWAMDHDATVYGTRTVEGN